MNTIISIFQSDITEEKFNETDFYYRKDENLIWCTGWQEYLDKKETYCDWFVEEAHVSKMPSVRFFVVYDSRAKAYRYFETAWSKKEVNSTSFWVVKSEHKTKDEARIKCENLNNPLAKPTNKP